MQKYLPIAEGYYGDDVSRTCYKATRRHMGKEFTKSYTLILLPLHTSLLIYPIHITHYE